MGWDIVSSADVGHWVAKRVDGGFFEGRATAIGLKRNDEIIAGVMYENWNHKTIWCHFAIEGQLTPAYLAAIFDYPFNVCQVDKIIVPVGSENDESLRLVKKMGFVEEGRIKDGRPDGDIVFLTLARDSCRYTGDRYGKRLTQPAPSA
jgi:RimJ/RimL family protein N-acetyltransferase